MRHHHCGHRGMHFGRRGGFGGGAPDFIIGWGMGRGGFGERGERGGRRRMFDGTELRLILLKLIEEQPRHGYDLIREIEERSGGAYAPSPGVIYPTLTLLEDLGYVSVSEGGGRKLYTITPEGEAYLADNQPMVSGLFDRMAQVAAASAAFSPQILRARENLKTALRLKLTAGALTAEQVKAIADALDAAAQAVEQA